MLGSGVLVLGVLLAACQSNDTAVDLSRLPLMRAPDDQQIAAVLQDVHAGMESKRIYKVLAHVAPHYQDQDGREIEALRRYLSEMFRGYRTIRITRTTPRIWVDGNRAQVIETFGTVATPFDNSSLPPLNLQGQVTVHLERVQNRWLIVQWGPLR